MRAKLAAGARVAMGPLRFMTRDTDRERRPPRRAHGAAAVEAPAAHEDEALYRPISAGMILRLVRWMAPYRWSYAAVCASGLGVAVLEMIPPRLVGRAIDGMASGNFALGPILEAAAMWAVVTVVTQVLHGVQIRQACRSGESVLADLRAAIFRHLQHLSMSFFDRTNAGRIISRAANDVDSLRNVMIWSLNSLVANGALMAFAAVMIARTDLSLFAAVAWLGPLMTALSFIQGRRVGVAWQKVRLHSTMVSANQAENISGARVVAAFNRQATNLRRFDALQQVNTENNIAASRLSGAFQPGLQAIRFLGQALVLVLGAYGVAQGRLRVGDLVAVSLYWECFMSPAANFAALLNDTMTAMAGAERVFALLDEKPDVSDAPDARDLPALAGEVRFEGVGFHYRPGRPVLEGIDFVARAGQTVALVGATGSGKSTIMSLLARFYGVRAGRILIDGHDLADVTGKSLHRQMAIVSQANFLFSGTILENLRYARPEATFEEVAAAARALGCHERFLRLKDGYDTPVGDQGANLSLGERQLVCFTRALLANPRLLLLDEATSAMDAATEAQLQCALKRLAAGRTTFIVAHRLSTIVNADLILVLDHGRIVERGRHDELLARGGKYAALHAHSLGREAVPALAYAMPVASS